MFTFYAGIINHVSRQKLCKICNISTSSYRRYKIKGKRIKGKKNLSKSEKMYKNFYEVIVKAENHKKDNLFR